MLYEDIVSHNIIISYNSSYILNDRHSRYNRFTKCNLLTGTTCGHLEVYAQ